MRIFLECFPWPETHFKPLSSSRRCKLMVCGLDHSDSQPFIYTLSLFTAIALMSLTCWFQEREIENQRAEITELRQRLQSLPKSPPVQQKTSSIFKFLAMFLVFLLMVLVVLSLLLHDMGSHVDLSPLVCQLSSLSFKPI